MQEISRVNIVSLGVKDLKRSKRFFFELFGWKPTSKDHENIIFYDMGGWILGLYPWDLLAEDAQVESAGSGFRGFTLAHNVQAKNEVGQVLNKAEDCGAEIIKPAQDVFWGGHSGYFRDLDGHLWEVAHNPFTPTKDDGTLDVRNEEFDFDLDS